MAVTVPCSPLSGLQPLPQFSLGSLRNCHQTPLSLLDLISPLRSSFGLQCIRNPQFTKYFQSTISFEFHIIEALQRKPEMIMSISQMRKLMLREVKYLSRGKQVSEQMNQDSRYLMPRSGYFPTYSCPGFLFSFPLPHRFLLFPPFSEMDFSFPWHSEAFI